MGIEKIGVIIFIIFLILGVCAFVYMVVEFQIKSLECAEIYGGRVVWGYCTYVENGTSRSFDIWEIQNITNGGSE